MPRPPEVAHPGAVLVLGASRGLGRAIAVAVAEAGFPVVLGCRDPAAATPAIELLAAAGHRAVAAAVEVTDFASVAAAVQLAGRFGPGLYALVNNAAAIAPLARLEVAAPADWARTLATNVAGPFNAIHAALPLLPDGGVVVNLSSAAADTPIEGWSAYCAGKAALAMLTRSLALEQGQRLRIYGVRPGMLDTDMQAEIRASGIGPASRYPRRELTPVDGPARAIAWLLRHAPADLSGREVDLTSPALQRRMAAAQ